MFHNDENIFMVFKKYENGYKFHSVETAQKDESGYYIGQSGVFMGRNMFLAPKFRTYTDLVFVNNNRARLFCIKPYSNFSTMPEYATYEIPKNLYEVLKRYQKIRGDAVALEILCQLGKITEFFYEEGEYFSVNHIEPQKYQEEIEDITRSLQGKQFSFIDMDNLNNLEKESLELAIRQKKEQKELLDKIEEKKRRMVGNLYMPEIYRIHSTTPPVRKADENVGYDQTTLEEQQSKANINQIISDIKGKIVGQDEAVESVVANIYANQKIIEMGNKDLIATQKASILLDGPTGTGKTAIVKEIADKLELPMVVTSATSYSTTGYVGSTITDILSKLYEKANGNLELAQRGIVIIDEFDKLGGFSKEKELSMRKGVQQELLAFISGGKYNVEIGDRFGPTIEFDTSNLTFISLGAFTSIRDQKIEENKNKTKNKTTIGFISSEEETKKVEVDTENKTYQIDAQDYIKYGLERELVGRFALLTSTKAYSKEDYKRILLESTISPLKTFIDFAKSFGVENVIYDDEFINKVSEMAYEANFGARGLHQIISNLKNVLLLDLINNKSDTITLTVDMLDKVKEKNIRTY